MSYTHTHALTYYDKFVDGVFAGSISREGFFYSDFFHTYRILELNPR